MKKALIIAMTCLVSQSIAQNKDSTIIQVIELCDEEVSFPGGQDAFIDWIEYNFKWVNTNELDESIRVFVEFKVNEEGHVRNVEVLKCPYPKLAANIEMILCSSPHWVVPMCNTSDCTTMFRASIYIDLQ